MNRKIFTLGSTCKKGLKLCGLVLSLSAFPVSQAVAYSTYSGASADASAVRGWGVTDVTNYTYPHTAKVSTTLRSPQGRMASSGTRSASQSVRADISLPWDDNDLGDYRVDSVHFAFCPVMGTFINNYQTAFQITAGLSFVCYHLPTPLGGGWFRYYLKGPCPVPCNTAEIDLYTGGPSASPEQVVSKPWYKLGTIYNCIIRTNIAWAAPGCVCSKVP